MNCKKYILIIAGILFLHASAFSQSFTNMGKEFWVGYGHHQFMEQGYDNSQEMVLYLCTHEQAATVTVRLEGSGAPIPPPFGGPWTRTYNIPPNTVVSIEDPMPTGVTVTSSPNSVAPIGPIPKGAPGQGGFDARLITPAPPIGTGGEGIFKKKGIHITSTTPIVAYAHIYGSFASGATMLMPVETWGYNYTSINSAQRNADNSYSWLYVVAKENNTRVQITPSVQTRLSKPAGVPFTIDLQKGEIYQLIGALTDPDNGLELTGTTVKSIDNGTGVCYPVAVFAGSSRTGGESDCWQSSGRDNDMQQMFPQEAWGKNYLTAPWSNSDDPSSLMINMYKVAINNPLTVVKRNGVPLTGLIGNKYYYFESATADHIESDQPVMLAQFASGGSPCNSTGEGDPEMVYLSPIEQAIKNVGFYRNTKESINTNYLTLIIPTAGVSSLKIDGTSFSAISAANKFTYPHPNLAGYSVCIRRWVAEKTQSFVQSDSAFTAITYGLGSAESYAFNAGTYINNLNARTTIHNVLDTAKKTNNFTCVRTNVDLSLLIAYQPSQIKWQMSYYPDVTPNNGDLVSGDGISIMPPEDSALVEGRMFYKYSVPTNPYIFQTAGSYSIPVSAKNPQSELCDPFEKFFIDVTVKEKPSADFSVVQTGCAADGVQFTGNSGGNGYTMGQWYWQFLTGVPANDSSKDVTYVFPVSDSTYGVKLTSVTEDGCSSDTVKNVIVPAGIKTTFQVTPAICEGDSVTITPGPEATTEWYWVFGDGQSDTLTSGNAFKHAYSNYGTFTIGHTIKGNGTCNSDTAQMPVTVYAKPYTNFSISPPGCLPADGVVQFTSAAFAPDGQVMKATGYLWDFADTVMTNANVTHTYNTFGSYQIRYKAETVNGCAKDTTVTQVFNVRPKLAYTLAGSRNICAGAPSFSVAGASVTNGVPGAGIYKGKAIIDPIAGIYSPALLPYGADTVWYVFTSTGGCVDSVFLRFIINAKPHPDFDFTASCLAANGLFAFNNTSSIADGTTMTYSWNFGDVNAPLNNTSSAANPTHNYTKEGTYSVKLTADASGCSADTVITAPLGISPSLASSPLTGVCENAAPFVLSFASVTNGVAGTGIYKGPGVTDGVAGTFNASAAGPSAPGVPHKLWYVFTSAGGCFDSIFQTIVVSPRAHPDFSYTSGCLSTDGSVNFINKSAIASGAAMNYNWDFGDATNAPANNTSTATNPSHSYIKEGSYLIKLAADANGCAADTTITAQLSITPSLASSPLTGVCENAAPFVLSFASVTNGVAGTGIYKGPGVTDGVAGTFNASAAGASAPGVPHKLWYVFTSAGGCFDSIFQTIVVSPRPHPDFSYTSGCLSTDGSVNFTNKSAIASGAAMNYNWDFGDAINAPANNTSTATNPSHSYIKEGSYLIKLAADANGCAADTTITAQLSITPSLASSPLTGVCEYAAPFVLSFASVTNGVAGTGIYKGPGVTDGVAGTFNASAAGASAPGVPHKLWYVFTSAGGCTDSISQTIVVSPRPHPAFSYTSGCLSTDGSVNFTNKSAIASGAAMNYNWDFGDAINAPANNTSTVANPLHNYTKEGTYTLKLTADAGGCSADTTLTATLGIKPALAAQPTAGICENSKPFVLSFGSVTNGVTGSYIYQGPGITDLALGIFDPTVSGAGSAKKIWYVFATAGGCIDSVSALVSVYPVPIADFSINDNISDNICLDSTALITSRSTISTGTITNWNWRFSNGEVYPPYTNGNPFTKSFAAAGGYDASLSVVSDSGCLSPLVTKTINVRPLPVADFSTKTSVCIPDGMANFSNLSTISDQTLLTYNWNFGDNTPLLTTLEPQHIYSNALTQTQVSLRVLSQYGCTDDTTKTIIFYQKPIADFSASPDTLCQGTQNLFTDLSSVPNSTIASRTWTFGDGSGPSTAANPVITFANPGDFVVKLNVTTAGGCSADTSKTVKVYLQPKIDAGPSFLVAEGDTVTFAPVVNSQNLTFAWTPPFGLSNPRILRPGLKVLINQTFMLTATGEGNCKASDTLSVRVTRPVKIPNAFTPNGDGINDTWVLTHLEDYPNSIVEVFNRYGKSVFISKGGYSKAWDGTLNGSPLPVSTYYYVINLNTGATPYSGYVAIIR